MGNIFGSGREKKRKMRCLGIGREKGLKFIGAQYKQCPKDYDEIVNLAGAMCEDEVWLPGELVVEILCKLAVKSLLRLKSVCKSWNLVVNSHLFIYKHLHRRNPQLGGYSLQFQHNILPVKVDCIIGVCNGIICLATSTRKTPFVLFNPSTREFSFVPPQLPRCLFSGFCYLPKTQQYQLIFFKQVKQEGDVTTALVDITTVTLGKITSLRVAKRISVPGLLLSDRPVICGTTMYWLAVDLDGGGNEKVIFYDVIQERFSVMKLPPYPFHSMIGRKTLQLLNGSLIMFVTPSDGFTFFDIWMMIDDVSEGKSWIKYRTVGPMATSVYPIEVCSNDRLILCSDNGIQFPYWSYDLFYYDLETDQVEFYCDFHAIKNYNYRLDYTPEGKFANYVESLVSIKTLVPYIDTDG